MPEAAEAGRAACARVDRALAPWSRASLAATFTDNRVDTSALYDGEDWARLSHLRATYDPTGRFVANHPI